MADPEAPKTITVFDPTTATYGTVPASEVDQAVQSGMIPEAPEDTQLRHERELYDTPLETVKAGAEGLARGATLGLSDPTLRGLGADPEAMARRQRLNPMVAGAGEAIGTGLGLLTGEGEVSLGLKGAKALATPARAAIGAGRLAEGAVGAGLRGLGVTGEGYLGRAFARGAELAASGAVEGGLFGAGHAVSEEALSGGNYDDLASKVWAGTKDGAMFGALIGGGLGTTLGIASKGAEQIGSGLRNRIAGGDARKWLGDVAAESAVQAIDPSKRALNELTLGARSTKSVNRIKQTGEQLLKDDIVAAGRSGEEMLARATDVADSRQGQLNELYNRLDKEAGFYSAEEAKSLFDAADAEIAKYRDSSLPAVRQVGERIEEQIAPMRELGQTGALYHSEVWKFRRDLDDLIKFGKPAGDPINDGLLKIRGLVEDSMESSVEHAAAKMGDPGLASYYRDVKKSYGAAKWAQKQLLGNEIRGQANRSISMLDTISGVGGAVSAAVSGGSLGLGAMGGLATSLAHKVLRENGRSVIADFANRLAKSDIKIADGVRKFVRGTKDIRRVSIGELGATETDRGLQRRARETRIQAAQRIADAVQRGPHDRQMVMDVEAPETAKAIRGIANRAASFLKSKVPAPMLEPSSPLIEKLDPGPSEITKFARYVEAVRDPLSVIDHLNDGTLSQEHVEALKSVHPERFAQLQNAFRKELTTAEGKKMPYSKRVALGGLLGIVTDRSLDPQAIRHSQDVLTAKPAQATPPPNTPPAKPVSDPFKSEAEKLESQNFAI